MVDSRADIPRDAHPGVVVVELELLGDDLRLAINKLKAASDEIYRS